MRHFYRFLLTVVQIPKYNFFIHTYLKYPIELAKKLEDPLYLGVFLAAVLFLLKTAFVFGENSKDYLNFGGPVNNTETALLSQEGALFSYSYPDIQTEKNEEESKEYVLINKAEAFTEGNQVETEMIARKTSAYKTNLLGYFKMPVNGYNFGNLHNYNAVDIASACGSEVVAAADGVVIEEDEGNWNSGYGSLIKLEHANGTKTLYAHNSENLVKAGDIVRQGEEIAKVGKTGNVSGPTGCHLHFEIYGAVNPFAK